jgi:hypothetical protein
VLSPPRHGVAERSEVTAVTWHVHDETLADYQQGRLDPARVMSVEAHVARCDRCRAALPTDAGWLAARWEAVLDTVEQPALGWAERLLIRAGLPDHRVRLLAATPALRRSWLLANAAVLVFAVLATSLMNSTGPRQLLVFLAIAPVLPVLAVATAYGSGVDPMYEIESATPAAGARLALWRAAAVLVSSVAMCAVAAVFLPATGWSAAAWLLPALALSAGSLALATTIPLRTAAVGLGGCWLAGVTAVAAWLPDLRAAFGPAAQLCYLGGGALAVVALTVRRHRLDPGEPR